MRESSILRRISCRNVPIFVEFFGWIFIYGKNYHKKEKDLTKQANCGILTFTNGTA